VLLAFGQTSVTHAIAAFAGMMALPLSLPNHEAKIGTTLESKPAGKIEPSLPSISCLATTICEVKDRVRWRTAAWKPAFCEKVAREVMDASKRYDIPPALIMAVMINESDMDEKAFRTTIKSGRVYAKDGGLMGIRCIVDKHGKCVNGNVRGMRWSDVMDPITNIDMGARELAHWRTGGGITNVTVRTRDNHGVLRTKLKHIPCAHRTHAYWAHYNHGPRYIDHGPARHYPHRIAVLYYALARSMHMDTSSLTAMHLTVDDPGKRRRTADRPVEARYQKLCQAIRGTGAVCVEPATAQLNTLAPTNTAGSN
jgi:hypothetical protein